MALKDDFQKAAQDVMSLGSKPDTGTLLELYALFKQASEGQVSGARPGMLDIKGRKKYDAWAGKAGLSAEDAMKKYIALVKSLKT